MELRQCGLALMIVQALGCTASPSAPVDEGSATSESPSETQTQTSGTKTGEPTSTETGDQPCPPAPCEPCSCVDGELVCECPPPLPEAGFIELEGVAYELGLGVDAVALESTPARWFWAYQGVRDPLDTNAPLFVLFNGGPGVSSGMLLGLNTGEASFAPPVTGPDLEVAPNPAPWTTLGHLLWIDARQTGFSYGLLDDPSDPEARAQALSLDSFNSYRDAADFVRVLLRFMAAHPELADNPVVLVAESYGGTRAQLMLDMLLHPGAYADGSRRMRDEGLRAEIEAHHQGQGVSPVDPAAIATQFGRQVLIQPALTGSRQQQAAGELFEQPGSAVHLLADELGVEYPTCAQLGPPCDAYQHALDWVAEQGRSAYDTRAPATWLSETFALVGARLNSASASAQLLGVEPQDIEWFLPTAREGAWRADQIGLFPSDTELGDWPEVAGPLQPWDRYFTVLHTEALLQFRDAQARELDIDPADPHFGELALSNFRWVDTMITAADNDLVVYTPAIADALRSYEARVAGLSVDDETWTLELLEPAEERSVYVPRYAAGHAVSLDLPEQLRADLSEWLGSN